MSKKITFKSRARLLRQLGDQLIRNERIALVELVKNAFDADASSVCVSMLDVNDKNKGLIIVEDDGVGMDRATIENAWLEIGSDAKEKDLKKNKRTKKYGRLPIGEKGIGRFGVHKLGDRIKMVTRKKGFKEVVLEINWNEIDNAKYLEELPIKLTEQTPVIFTGSKTGTRIEINNLRVNWTEPAMKEAVRAINTLQSPFCSKEAFHTEIITKIDGKEPDFLKNQVQWEKIRDQALYHVDIEMEGSQIKKFRYKFVPLPGMKKLKSKTVTEKDVQVAKFTKMYSGKEKKPIDLSKYKIGKISFSAYIFSREISVMKLGVLEPAFVKEYLDENGGVRVFRDGMRVYDYGEHGNDWLGLDIERVNNPGKKISNSLIVGAVSLERAGSADLIEKTNREGFVENEAYKTFRYAIGYAIDKVAGMIAVERSRIRELYGPTKINEPVLSDIAELKKYAEKNIKEAGVRKEVATYLKRIEDEYRNVNEILLRSAGAGLTMSMVIHEIDKLMKALNVGLRKEKVSENVLVLVKDLANLIEGYSSLISRSPTKEEKLKPLIERALDICHFRFLAHGIELISDYRDFKTDPEIRCAKNLFMSAMVNILDNSIWWLGYAEKAEKKIVVTISEELPGFTTVVIADNGPGISLPTDKITEPFISGKEGGTGLGLHIAKEIMVMHGGLLLFPEKGDFRLPNEFNSGAVVALAFKNIPSK